MSSSSARVHRSLRSFYYLRGSLNTQIRAMLERSLCATHLDYCAAVFSFLDVRTSSMPKVAMNACISFIINIPRYASVTTYQMRLGFLSCKNQRLYFALVLFYKVGIMKFPPQLVHSMALQLETLHRRGRSSKSFRFRLPKFRHKSFAHLCSSVSAWNKLPESIKSSESLPAFKNTLLAYISTV